jgi:hypothetical protein
MTRPLNSFYTLATAAILGLASTAYAGTISTLPSTGNIGSFGNVSSGSTPTYGQTFKASAGLGLYMRDFTFYFNNSSSSALSYQAQVYRWNGNAITGPALFSINSSLAGTGASYVGITTQTNDILLQDQLSYIALFTTVNTSGSVGGARALTSADSAYTNGTFAFNNNGTMAGLSSGWAQNVFGDLAFTMNFDNVSSSVPEAGTLPLFGIGLLGALFILRRKSI